MFPEFLAPRKLGAKSLECLKNQNGFYESQTWDRTNTKTFWAISIENFIVANEMIWGCGWVLLLVIWSTEMTDQLSEHSSLVTLMDQLVGTEACIVFEVTRMHTCTHTHGDCPEPSLSATTHEWR